MHIDLMEMSSSDYETLCKVLYRLSGLSFKPGKEVLMRARLSARVRALGLGSFREYLMLLQSGMAEQEYGQLVDTMTTNKTSFFRDPRHFDLLRTVVFPSLSKRERIRLWSAACSTGEEPYSIAMILASVLPNTIRRDSRILATDISGRVLEHARAGNYDRAACQEIPESLRERFMSVDPGERHLAARTSIRNLVHFAELNLTASWPMKGPFDVIFCRNVMIYFDMAVRQTLADRFWDIMTPGGYLFLGCAESLTGLSHRFKAIEPAFYQKPLVAPEATQ